MSNKGRIQQCRTTRPICFSCQAQNDEWLYIIGLVHLNKIPTNGFLVNWNQSTSAGVQIYSSRIKLTSNYQIRHNTAFHIIKHGTKLINSAQALFKMCIEVEVLVIIYTGEIGKIHELLNLISKCITQIFIICAHDESHPVLVKGNSVKHVESIKNQVCRWFESILFVFNCHKQSQPTPIWLCKTKIATYNNIVSEVRIILTGRWNCADWCCWQYDDRGRNQHRK